MSTPNDHKATAETEHTEPRLSVHDLRAADLEAIVRFHGANDVIDAVLATAVAIYGDPETAIEKCHETFLRRASALRTPAPPCRQCGAGYQRIGDDGCRHTEGGSDA